MFENTGNELYARELAFWTAINLIANAISKCEFRTFRAHGEIKEQNYYKWNIEPNINQNSSEFLRGIIARLYRFNECLVIEQSGNLLIADSFKVNEFALFENIFSEVRVGDFTFNRTFLQSEVLHFRL